MVRAIETVEGLERIKNKVSKKADKLSKTDLIDFLMQHGGGIGDRGDGAFGPEYCRFLNRKPTRKLREDYIAIETMIEYHKTFPKDGGVG